MFKTSKQVNGVSVNARSVVPHSSPTPRITIPSIESYKLPILAKRVESVGEPLDREGSASINERIFSLTGVSSSEPSILISSNFIPIWEGERLNTSGESVYLREVSRMVNSKVSLLILSGTSGSIEFASNTRAGVKNYIDNEEGGGFSTTYLDLTDSTSTSLDIGSGNFLNLLLDGGYTRAQVSRYSPSKIYLQTLVEVKRNTSTYTSHLIAQGGSQRGVVPEDSDPLLLSDLDVSLEKVKIWMNPAYSTPRIDDLIQIEKIGVNLELLTQFSSVQFIEVGSNNPRTVPNSILNTYRDSSRDISFLGTLLMKEARFSNTLKSGEAKELLSTRYGYTLATSGGNFQLWDHLFGRFTKSVLDPVTTPTGKGNSLVSFSTDIIPISGENKSYHVLTWENSPITGSSITPGVEYYVDAISTTTGGTAFETTRLNSLTNKSYMGNETIMLIESMLGWNPNGSRREFSPLSFTSLITRFAQIPLFYSSRIILTQNGLGGLDGSALRNLSQNDRNGLRIPSLICKLCIQPTNGFRDMSDRLKSLLFMWAMNYVKLRGSTNEIKAKCWVTIEKLRMKIAEEICGVFTAVQSKDYAQMMEAGRIFTVTSTNFSLEISSPSVKSTRNYSNFVEGFSNAALTDFSHSVWSILIDTLYELGNNFNIYSGGSTGYSNLTQETYLWNCFELLLRIISSGVPENLIGTFSTGQTSGIVVDAPSPESLGEYFDSGSVMLNLVGATYAGEDVCNRMRESLQVFSNEEEREWNGLKIIHDILGSVYRNSNSLLSFLRGNTSTEWLRVVKPLYDNDASLLPPEKKSALLNLSLSREQFVSSLWRESESTDRVWDEKWYGVLRSHPLFSDIPQNCGNLLPINPLKLISFPSLSPYFKGNSFQKAKGNNLQILSVGIPHRLNRTLRSSPSAKDPNSNVIRIRVFKLDRLHPDIVYNPKEFLFEMNRFPTRSLDLWEADSILGGGSNLLSLPTKLVNYRGEVKNCKNYDEGFEYDLYGNSLTSAERIEIYKNHSLSFLLEEYLRWFTGVELDEGCWGNFTQLTAGSPIFDEGYSNMINNVKSGGRFTVVGAKVVDPTGSLIEPDDSLKFYLRNETLFLSADTISRKHVYPRKFDRVFTMVVDPDEFTVDSSHSTQDTLSTLRQLGVLLYDERSKVYTHRDTSERDISMSEYFTTIEPIVYKKEGMQA